MSSFLLKILAVVSMTIDHTGALLLISYGVFRVIGRLAFPIYAFLSSEGAARTGNINKYLIRLGIFALISEIPYDLFRTGSIFNLWGQNIFFTLFLGVAAIKLYKEKNSLFPVVLCAVTADLLITDYGWYGVTLIFVFYYFRTSKLKQLVGFASVSIIHFIFLYSLAGLSSALLQLYCLAAALPIYLYNGKKGNSFGKLIFYAYYPLHLLVLFFIYLVLER